MILPGKYVCLFLVVSAFWAMATHRKHDDQTEHHFPFMCMFELDFIFCTIPTSKSNGFASNLTGHGTFFVTNKLNNCNSHAHFTLHINYHPHGGHTQRCSYPTVFTILHPKSKDSRCTSSWTTCPFCQKLQTTHAIL